MTVLLASEPLVELLESPRIIDARYGVFFRLHPASIPSMLTGVKGIAIYVHIDAPSADAVALWTVMTYVHPRLEVAPFLALMSATRRCGKSSLRGVLQTLVRKPFTFSGRITEAVLFRLVEIHEPTLLLDEIDTYLRDDPHLRGDINGSQERSGAQAVRCVGDDNLPRGFNTWCAKLFAGIGHLPATTADRALIVRMERAPRSARPDAWRERDRDAVDRLRGRILRWTTDNECAILTALRRQSFPPVLHDRARDCWESLFAISEVAGGAWCAPGGRAWEASIFIAARGDTDGESARETLIGDLYAVFAEHGDPAWLPTDTILGKLNAMESRPWPEWSRGKMMTPRGLAKELGHFDVKPRNHQFGNGKQQKSYEREALRKAAFDSYAPEGSHPSARIFPWTDRVHENALFQGKWTGGRINPASRHPALRRRRACGAVGTNACTRLERASALEGESWRWLRNNRNQSSLPMPAMKPRKAEKSRAPATTGDASSPPATASEGALPTVSGTGPGEWNDALARIAHEGDRKRLLPHGITLVRSRSYPEQRGSSLEHTVYASSARVSRCWTTTHCRAFRRRHDQLRWWSVVAQRRRSACRAIGSGGAVFHRPSRPRAY